LNSTDLIAINNSIMSTLPINLVLNHGAAGNVTLAGTLDLAVGSLDIQNAGVSGTGTLDVTGGTDYAERCVDCGYLRTEWRYMESGDSCAAHLHRQ